jgi:hypothetical protein
MLTLKDLEAAFEADLLLAGARLNALSVIERAVKDVTDLGFRVEIEAYPLGDGGGILSPAFCLDAFASPVVAEVIEDGAEPDPAEIEAAVREFMGAFGTVEDLTIETDEPVDLMDATPEPPAVDPIVEAVAQMGGLTDAEAADMPTMPSPPKTDYRSRYAGLTAAKAPLSAEDRATILRMHKLGESSGAIAAALGRDPRGFYHQINTVVIQATPFPVPAEGAPTAAVSSASAVPVAEVAASVPAKAAPSQEARIANAVDAPPPGKMSDADKRLDAHLEALGNKGKWSDPADDLFLVEELSKGAKLAVVALELDIDADVCRKRFDALVPTKTAEEQAAVVKALRRRAVAARARAA